MIYYAEFWQYPDWVLVVHRNDDGGWLRRHDPEDGCRLADWIAVRVMRDADNGITDPGNSQQLSDVLRIRQDGRQVRDAETDNLDTGPPTAVRPMGDSLEKHPTTTGVSWIQTRNLEVCRPMLYPILILENPKLSNDELEMAK
ncbi:hypothetical protein LSH36_14g05032 [Paralvinella palmiformis]|uniref:Uncharacterized protein n=1 Tax=Paralvinella palmiformis TaxID=53620 RepID=A0AAD9NHT0_9ANNE|nr:hypothetical protein LSH36_14g05032 [Paralvinella palmiformis]